MITYLRMHPGKLQSISNSRLAATRDDIVGMTADLGKYTDLHLFAEQFPDRFYQMGMAEQLLMSSAAGMAREGFTVFATTYAVFASRRAVIVCQVDLNVEGGVVDRHRTDHVAELEILERARAAHRDVYGQLRSQSESEVLAGNSVDDVGHFTLCGAHRERQA